jgi:hypothetical protein
MKKTVIIKKMITKITQHLISIKRLNKGPSNHRHIKEEKKMTIDHQQFKENKIEFDDK